MHCLIFCDTGWAVTTQIIWFTGAKMFATGPFRISQLVPALSSPNNPLEKICCTFNVTWPYQGENCLCDWVMFKCLPLPLNPEGIPGFPHGSERHLWAQPFLALVGGGGVSLNL